MPRKSPRTPTFWLHSVSVVVTAEFHNPSILNPDFLRRLDIVPDDWEVVETMTSPGVSTVNYSNRIRWTVELGKLTVTQECNSPFRDSYEIHGIVTDYIGKLPHVPYKHLGLNWEASMIRQNPETWLKSRFLKPGDWQRKIPKVLGLVPKFVLEAEDATCNITLNPGAVKRDKGAKQSAVIIQCNFHHKPSGKLSELQAIISQWPDRQVFLVNALKGLLQRR